ncbi:G5 domain-containing protein [Pectinatus frisingensis]|uniref:G5 domain-containing protein n=1 Tax=Pectinatus frisingensis TaxID=865 RepID=UPI0018C6AB41|nr:G5 domain-containing protein [Pectinatus frisingensis]
MTVREIFLHHTKFTRIATCLTLIAVMSVVAGFSKTSKNIRVIADGQTTVVSTMYDSPKDIIGQAGIKLKPSDTFVLSSDNLKDGATITVKRAVPVTVEVAKDTRKVKTTAGDVQSLLQTMGYDPLNFYVLPNEEAAITPNMLIRLEPLINKIVFRDQNAPFNTIYRDDDTMPQGTAKVIQQGSDGIERFMVREYYNGGKKVDEQVMQKSVIKQTVPQIVAQGTYVAPSQPVDNGQIPPYISELYVQASAYLPTDGSGTGYTATGMRAQHGVVAVDPNVIPLGTRLYIPGYGEAVAADTGGFSGNSIDICVDSYSEAINWGRRNITIYILPN